MVLFKWQKSHCLYYTLLVICLDISSGGELIWFCLLWCVVLHAFRVYWYAFVSRSEGVSVCMLYNCEWNSPAFLVQFCVLMSLQASCPIFSYLEQHCIHVQWHCVCWCHFKCLILSFLFGTAQYLCTVTLCVLMSLQASCPIFSFWNSTVFMYSDFIFHRTRLPLSCLWQCWSSSVAVCCIASLPALLSVC